jgi:hypothetical protein
LAVAQTSIGLLVISVITPFEPLDDAVAAGGQSTRNRAVVCVIVVGVVTLFDTGVQDAVTASSPLAETRAFVGVGIVAVVALLDFTPDDPIAAGRRSAEVGALVGVEFIAIVTLFPLLDDPIPTNGDFGFVGLAGPNEKQQC